MAQEIVQVRLVDDLDGVSDAAGTITYSVDGISYEIDLSVKNLETFRKALEPFNAKARRRGKARPAVKRGGTVAKRTIGIQTRASSREPLPAGQEIIRAWAKSKRIKVSERGRIPNDVVKQYAAANK